MRECRYQGECEHENYNPCYPADDVVCKGYQPIPDVQALLALADEMTIEKSDIWGWSSRIREALGVTR